MTGLVKSNHVVAFDQFTRVILDNWAYCSLVFSASTLLVGRQEGHPACKKLSGGVRTWLSVWSEVQTCIWPSWCHCHSLSLASVKSRLVLPFWQRAVKRVCVCVCVCKHVFLVRNVFPSCKQVSAVANWTARQNRAVDRTWRRSLW